MKTYRKTATIQAEQFDGSDEMIEKYAIGVMPAMMINQFGDSDDSNNWSEPSFCINTLEGKMRLRVGDWIATGVKGERWAIADNVFKQTYEEVEECKLKLS